MAPIGFKLFGVNDKNELVWREPNRNGDPWKVIQSLDETENSKTLQVKHVASVEGVLFLINDGTYTGGNPGKLLARFATLTSLAAGAVGHAWGVSSLASYKGALYSLSSYLGKRVPDFANSPWVGASDLPFLADTRCMAATREYLIAAVQTDNQLRKWKPGMASWEPLDSNSGKTASSGPIVAIAAVGDDVYAIINTLGKTHELWVRRDGNWESQGKIEPVRTMTAALAVDLSKTFNNVAELQAVAV